MKRAFVLILSLYLTPLLWADQPAPPPIPMPSGDNALPPPPDQLTPVTVPSLSSDNTNTQPAANPPAPTATSVPSAPAASTPTTAPAVSIPTPVPTQAAPPPTEQPTANQSAALVSLGETNDYFPVTEGAVWTYEYLKPGPGETAKRTFTVKCMSAKAMANGTVRAVFETTEGSSVTKDYYSLFNGKVEHMSSQGTVETGDFAFKLPAQVGEAATSPQNWAAYWTVTEKNGTVHKSKAAYGQAQVYQKTYRDCLVVTEKVIKGGKTANTVIYYYAKGIGLVSMEVYSPSMKLIQTKSTALVSGPGN